ncbi:MAG: pyridoxamine 5'-phosphate oxidase family protein [Actinobacteria bacterium]|nr:pyridoxamine 5'-phosphate oxidase family protein [Actinomycetota bacterium]
MEDHPSEQSPPETRISETIRVRRAAERASYETEAVNAIVDASLVAHVGTVRDGLPVVIPMFVVRDGDHLLLHGAPAAGTLRRGKGTEVCVTMTLVDGLVLARSSLHHSINYRSVVVIGTAVAITDPAEKEEALVTILERLVPTRQADLRATTEKENRSTEVLRLSLAQASAKVRTGPPVDEDDDYAYPMWAGVLPVTTTIGEPIADPKLTEGIELPDNVKALVGREL